MLNHSRILLCASAAHCAQVLQAAAHARIALHGVQPSTQWPHNAADGTLLLWALLPAQAQAHESALELRWREQWLQGSSAVTIQMLYGSAVQQAQQLAPWIQQPAEGGAADASADCVECLDAQSEQKLFQHLLQRA